MNRKNRKREQRKASRYVPYKPVSAFALAAKEALKLERRKKNA